MSEIRRFASLGPGLWALASFVILLAACNDLPWSFSRRPATPNVIIITLDTTRADRIGCYGHEPAETPALDLLAKQGIRFEHAYSQVPLTLPSHSTLFTGTYPPEHGVRANGQILHVEKTATMAGQFAEQGYRTGAFVSAFVLDAMFGLAPGFETYSDEVAGETLVEGHYAEVPADVVTDRVLGWLEQGRDKPFFCWVHFFDPHEPLTPPPPYDKRHADMYDGEIAFMDSQIDRLIKWLEARSLRDKTVVIVVADHGESLGEHGEPTHGFFVYNTTLGVPLIFSAPGWLPKAKVVEETVGIVDIFPTVMELMQWEVPETVSGKSFFPALQGKRIESMGVYAESDMAFNQFGWAQLRAFFKGPWHFIRAPRPELYHMTKDPDELQNRFAAEKTLSEQLDQELAALEKSMNTKEVGQAPLDQRSREILESLGYLHGGGTPEAQGESEEQINPKDMIRVYSQVLSGRKRIAQGRLEEGILELEKALASIPETVSILSWLGRTCAQVGKREKAKTYLEKALKLQPYYPDALNELGLLLVREGRFQEGISHYMTALEVNPDDAGILLNLGFAKMMAGEVGESISIYKKVLERRPDFLDALYKLGLAYAKQGSFEEALSAFRSAIRLKADYWQSYNDLADVLLRMERYDEALEAARKSVDLKSAHPTPYLTLAQCYAEKNMPEDALKALEQAVHMGFADTEYLRKDIHFKTLAGSQEFEKLFAIIEEKLADATARTEKE